MAVGFKKYSKMNGFRKKYSVFASGNGPAGLSGAFLIQIFVFK